MKYNTEQFNLPNEEWKDVQTWEGIYQCSNFGRIKRFFSFKNGTIKERFHLGYVKPDDGHLQFVLQDNGRKQLWEVHRLIFETFYRRLLPNEEVHHLNQIKDCNKKTNLVAWDKKRHRQFHMEGNTFNIGKHLSQEHKKKISESKKGKKRAPFSQEWKRHLSESRKKRLC